MTQEDVTGDRPDDDTSALIGVAPSTARASSLARSVARSVAFGRVRSVGSVGPSTARGGRARSFIHSFGRSLRIDMTVVSDGEETDAELAAYVETAMTTAMASSTSRARRTGTGTTDGGTRGARGGGRRAEEDGGADVDGDGGVARTGGGGGGGRRRGVDGEDELDAEEDEDDVGEDIGGRGADERDADADAVDDERGEDEMEDGVEDETARIVRLGPLGRARIRGGGTTGQRVDARVTETTEDEDEDEDEDPREEWMNDSAKDLWLPVRGRGREAKTEVEVRDEHEHEDARPSDSASPRGILTPTGSLRNNGKRTVRFESSLPHGFPERKPSLVKACCSRGRALDSDGGLHGVDQDDDSTPWVGFLLVILTVTFVACCGELFKRLYSLVTAPASPFLFL